MKSVMKHYKDKFMMIKFILQKENPTVLEIGSHYGEDSLRFLETFKNIKLYCFEPDERNIEIFKKYVNDKRVKLFEIALSDKTGYSNFYQSFQEFKDEEVPEKYDWISKEDYVKNKLNNSGSSSLKKGYSHIINNSIKVKTKRYDELSKEENIGNIDFAWIDVQGAEKDVLLGMGNEVNNINFIWIEYGETKYEDGMGRKETIDLMSSFNFVIDERFSNRSFQGDALFVNKRILNQ